MDPCLAGAEKAIAYFNTHLRHTWESLTIIYTVRKYICKLIANAY